MRVSDEPAVRFKIADEAWELAEIHRLNYRTFVEEIPQHPPNADGRLVDAFHAENEYIVAVRGRRLVGMLAVRGKRPFSLDRKLPDLDRYLPPGRRLCEVRLLATTADSRNGSVFRGLVDRLLEHARAAGYDLAVISGTVRQTKLYRHLGFVPFGPTVGAGDAVYQPMYLTREALQEHGKAFRTLARRRAEPVCLLPGPTAIHPAVQAAFARPPISHRAAEFLADFEKTRAALRRLANARHVQILMGSGTLANDVVAAELSRDAAPGLILSNGAFGDRLVDHANRFGLRFETLRVALGKAFAPAALAEFTAAHPHAAWMWAVHGETSTGVLNDLALLKSQTAERGLRLCLDAVSSFGAAPLNLAGVALATGVSGKGVGSYPGLAFVFHEDEPRPADATLPRYLDLGSYAEHAGVPFTLSSNQVQALRTALEIGDFARRFVKVAERSNELHAQLRRAGFRIVAESSAFPAVTTVELPLGCDSMQVGERLDAAGFLLHYRSAYLRSRNWMQVCLMGHCATAPLANALVALVEAVENSAPPK